MEFSNRNVQAQTAAPSPHTAGGSPGSSKRNSSDQGKWARFGIAAAVAAVIVLLVALVALIGTSNSASSAESKIVNTKKLQAVFLNTGQVYFGNIKTLNSKYFVVTNIYYLQTSNSGSTGANANTNVSLVKLGCELHEPYDQMVINRDQVTFWENLQDNGQVAQAVTKFEKQNPSGQKCADQSTSAGTNSSNSAQNAGSNSGSSTSGSSTTTNNSSTTRP